MMGQIWQQALELRRVNCDSELHEDVLTFNLLDLSAVRGGPAFHHSCCQSSIYDWSCGALPEDELTTLP